MRVAFLLPILLVACKSSNENGALIEEGTATELSFSDFVSEIPAYEFPVKMTCEFDLPALNMDFSEYVKYFPNGGRVVSKLNTDGEYNLIIFDFACDYSCPTLYSFDAKGNRVDSLSLTPGQCGEDQFMTSRQWFLIDENINIDLIDTTRYYTDTIGIQRLDSTVVRNQKFEFNKTGKFDLKY